MTRNQIIQNLYLCPKINLLISNLAPKGFKDDLKQELFVILLEQPDQLIFKLHRQKELQFYCTRIILNITSKTGSFYRNIVQGPDNTKIKEYLHHKTNSLLPDSTYDFMKPILAYLYMKSRQSANDQHEVNIFEKYMESKGGCPEVSRFYDIPQYHVYEVVRRVKKQIIQLLKDGIQNSRSDTVDALLHSYLWPSLEDKEVVQITAGKENKAA